MLGLLVLEQLQERGREAVERPGVGPVRGVQAGVLHREEGPVGERHRVGQEQGLPAGAVLEVVEGVGRDGVVGGGRLEIGDLEVGRCGRVGRVVEEGGLVGHAVGRSGEAVGPSGVEGR